MSRTNFHGLNLTHFQVLLIVLECGSATRAAHRLSLTPSAISHSLARLREVLGDPLFLRRGNTLEPTARAREIGARIRPLVESLSASLEPPYFDPATATREFRVLASPYALVTLLPDLFETVVPIAPYSSMKLISAHDVPALACLVDGTIDVVLPSQQQQRPDNFDPFGMFFNRGIQQRVAFAAPEQTFNVLPLPEAGKPVSFSGAVGSFKIAVSAGPTYSAAPISICACGSSYNVGAIGNDSIHAATRKATAAASSGGNQ